MKAERRVPWGGETQAISLRAPQVLKPALPKYHDQLGTLTYSPPPPNISNTNSTRDGAERPNAGPLPQQLFRYAIQDTIQLGSPVVLLCNTQDRGQDRSGHPKASSSVSNIYFIRAVYES